MNEIELAKQKWQDAGITEKGQRDKLATVTSSDTSTADEIISATRAVELATSNTDARKSAFDALNSRAAQTQAGVTPVLLTGGALPVTRGAVEKGGRYYGKLRSFPNTPEGRQQAYDFALLFSSLVAPADSAVRKDARGKFESRFGVSFETMERRAMSETVNSALGYLVPIEFSNHVIRIVEEFGKVRAKCLIVPMSSDKLTIPRRQQGFRATWSPENSKVPLVAATVNSIALSVQNLAIYLEYSNQLNEDTMVNLGDYFATEAALGLAYTEEDTIFNADGTALYGGHLGLSASFLKVESDLGSNKSIFDAPSGSASDWSIITRTVWQNYMSKLRLYTGSKPELYMTNGFYQSVIGNYLLTGGGNTNTTIVNGAPGQATNTYEQVFQGYPVNIVEVMPFSPAGSPEIPCYAGTMDMSVAIGERSQVTMASSREAGELFQRMQTGLLVNERIAINVFEAGATTFDQKGNHIAGPIIALRTAS